MYTRCPGCQSVYELDAQRLAEAAGVVRCGHCGKTFNSLSSLFAEHPRAKDAPLTGAGMPPLLDYRAIVQPELPGVSLVDEPPDFEHEPEPSEDRDEPGPILDLPGIGEGGGPASSIWVVASLALSLILVTQLAFQWTDESSGLRSWIDGDVSSATAGNPREAIQITSRDMHRHPSLDDAVIVSATLRNRSEERLAWPVLEVRLYDASQQVLGVRRLQPEDYLVNPDNAELGMPSELIVPVIIEFVVGTTLPSGFDFRFF
ncbi:hypothetical protein AY599_02440 [Leptolyngbya valderiana BDU 20041]|nr:hypothetical protein AY599_02440 [Leptolyngbya valderiana BDU 20041]